ncbi:hypothetical protein CI610_03101 [invertebrate metagenome]|uniref:Uncharacterized protein n=1 Tax=invertebrate metagenome TaxID=1711999 RepID=A0A2H9T435_9ZZZZ
MDNAADLSYIHNPAVKPFNYTTVVRVDSENSRLRPNQEIFVLFLTILGDTTCHKE